MNQKGKGQKAEQKEKVLAQPAESVILQQFDDFPLSVGMIKQQMILSYIKEISIGLNIKPKDSLQFNFCGRKAHAMIKDIQPINQEGIWTITIKTVFLFEAENKSLISAPVLQKKTLLYIDKTLLHLSNLVDSSLGNKAQKIRDNGLPLVKGVLLTGGPGTGKSQILSGLHTQYAHFNPILISGNKIEQGGKELANLLDRATSENQLILIDDYFQSENDQESNHNMLMMRLFDIIESQPTLVIATAYSSKSVDERLRRSGRFEFEVIIDLPSSDQRTQILEAELSKLGVATDIQILTDISQQLSGFNINDIRSMVREFFITYNNDDDLKSGLKSALQKLNPTGLKDLLAEVPQVAWEDIGGYEEIKDEIRRAVEWPIKHPEQFKQLGIAPSKGVLLYGPPGCSKTLLARALCTQCNLTFMAVKGPEIFSKYVGDSEKAIRDIFKKARICAPTVIFFDEIDAIAPQRQGTTDVSDRVLIQLLTEMDGFESLKNVIVIAATNRPGSIDKALLRPGRFDSLIFLDIPDTPARQAIFMVNINKMKVAQQVKDSIDWLVEGTQGFTGAEICQICREAGLNALNRDIYSQQVEMDDFKVALSKSKPSVSYIEREKFQQFANHK